MTTATGGKTAIGERIDDLCVEHDLSYHEIAARLNINRTTLYHWRNRPTLPDALVTLVMIADQFSVSTDWLLGRTTERRPHG
jgi:transcriptional regulator with XRE-family HTH domain